MSGISEYLHKFLVGATQLDEKERWRPAPENLVVLLPATATAGVLGQHSQPTSRRLTAEFRVNGWHADHVMEHDAAAIECFLLMAFLTLISYHALLYLNLKPAIRKNKSEEDWVNLMAAEIYGDLIPSALS